MMIDKRLIETVKESKKWIAFCVFYQWLGLIANITSTTVIGYAIFLGYHKEITLSGAIFIIFCLLFSLIIRIVATKKAVTSSYLASKDVKHHLRTLILKKLQAMPLSQLNEQSTAQIMNIASDGVEQLEIYFGRYLPQLFYSLLAPLTLFIFLAFFNLISALILLICLPLIPFSIIVVNKIAKRLLHKYWGIYLGLGSSFLDNLQGLVTLKVYQDDEFKAYKMNQEAEHFRRITMKVLTMQLNSISIMDLLAYGGASVGIISALLAFQAGNLSLIGVILFILLSAEFFIPLRLLGSFFHVAMQGKTASDNIFALLDQPISDNVQNKELNLETVKIEIKDLNFGYKDSKKLLQNINIAILPQKLTAIVGKSGSGKSTIVSLLMGFYDSYQGYIICNGNDIKNISRESLYANISLVSHQSYFFKGTLLENMKIANPKVTDEEIIKALEQVNLLDFVLANNGLDMKILSQASNLSGGQIQRLALARALIRNSACYIFDEATSNIDIESEQIIIKVIHQLKQTKTVIMISHRLANIIESDNIYVLDEGKLCQSGKHNELICKEGIYKEIYNQQQKLEQIAQGGKKYE